MELGTALVTVGLGAPTIIGIIIGVFKWSLSRNVHHEDERNRQQAELLKEHGDELRELREDRLPAMQRAFDDRFNKLREELDQRVAKLREDLAQRDAALATLTGELRGVSSGIGELRGTISQLTGQLETGREKQAAAHREAMRELDVSIRQEISRHVHPELPEKVAKLEAQLNARTRKRG